MLVLPENHDFIVLVILIGCEIFTTLFILDFCSQGKGMSHEWIVPRFWKSKDELFDSERKKRKT